MHIASLRSSLFAAALAAAATGQQAVPEVPTLAADRASGADTIVLDDLTAWLAVLSSDEYGGRATGTKDFAKAADFVKDHFEEWGLKPGAADGSYFQVVPWEQVSVDDDSTKVLISGEGDAIIELRSGKGLSGRASVDSSGTGPLTLLIIHDLQESGIEELDLEGRVVMMAAHPGAANRLSERRRRFAPIFLGNNGAKALQAGASAVLMVGTDGMDASIEGVRRNAGRNRAAAGRGRMPNTLAIPLSVAKDILRQGGLSEDLVAATDPDAEAPGDDATTGRHDMDKLSAEVNVTVATTQAPAWNVVGIVPGSDPQLKDEYVVIGSHLDHIGRSSTTVNNGADDDGSGTTGVLGVARAFAKNQVRPRRSVLFVCFCGEENGLVGSRYFADNSPIPLSSIVAELQMDMIGRNEEKGEEKPEDNLNCLHLVGTQKLSNDLHNLCMGKNESHGFAMEFDEEGVFSRSDHANFAAKGIPIAFFFTGFHPDYHRPTDTVEKINFPKLRRIALYVYDIAFDLAQADDRPMVDEELWEANRRQLRGAVETPAAPVRPKK